MIPPGAGSLTPSRPPGYANVSRPAAYASSNAFLAERVSRLSLRGREHAWPEAVLRGAVFVEYTTRLSKQPGGFAKAELERLGCRETLQRVPDPLRMTDPLEERPGLLKLSSRSGSSLD